MGFAAPPQILLDSASLNRAMRVFVGRMSRAFQAASRVPVEKSFGVFVPEPLITSWYRDKELNADVGGEQFSQHRFALAFDMEGEEDKIQNLVAEAIRVGLIAFAQDEDMNVAHFQLLRAGTIPPAAFTILDRILEGR